uniref:hypoxia-inducible factor-proline dioxygenase n=1 Tax=Heterorhabditis bacteriophora TaxID=37862 RepID=A0A1I7XN28_HETBA
MTGCYIKDLILVEIVILFSYQFDWKRHKPLCKTLQSRRSNDEQRGLSASEAKSMPEAISLLKENSIQYEGCATAFRPYSNTKTSVSFSNGNASPVPVSPASTSVIATVPSAQDERIVLTDDPDIQIIEGPSTKGPSRSRKRPTPSNSAEGRLPFKDHNKNLVYQTTLQDHQRHLTNRGLAVNIHQAMVLRLRYIAEHVIRSLNEFGWAVVDNFLGPDHCRYTNMEIERLYSRGLFSAGQLMESKHKDEHHIKDIRSDNIYWFDGTDKRADDAATVRLLISMIDSVIQHFKKRLPPYDIGGRSRAMIAIYPGNGTRYVKHVDNPVKDGRCITTIYYCNEDWDMAKDGGMLRLYPETSATPMDIDPRADRLVFFWSDRRNPHEVMPVYRNRFAITIWYMDKEERKKALQRQKEMILAGGQEEGINEDQVIKEHAQPMHELSRKELRMFQNTSSEPVLVRCASNEKDQADSSLDSGVNSSVPDLGRVGGMVRISSLQSITDAFKNERAGERCNSSSTSEEANDIEELPVAPPTERPEYQI